MSNFDDLDRLLKTFSEKTVPGCGCAVAQHGKILYEGYSGYADLERGIPITEDTVYRLFSMTKIIVCTAAMIQFERGKFLLNEPYSQYFPEYRDTQVASVLPNGEIRVKPAQNPILICHTFNMSNGLPYPNSSHYTDLQMREVRKTLTNRIGKYTLQDDVRAMGKVPVRFEPGSHWLYGFGHEMVAALVEETSGMSIGEFLKKEIFEPLGMESTGYRYFGNMRERMAKMYRPNGDGTYTLMEGSLDANHEPDAVYEGGGAGLFSTVKDYLKFTQMLANGGNYNGTQIIGRKTIDLMRRNMLNDVQLQDFRNSYLEGYGYGLGVRTMMEPAGAGNLSVGEFGWTGVAGTWTSIDPSEGVSVVYMHQTDPNNEEYHHHRVRAVAYGCIQ